MSGAPGALHGGHGIEAFLDEVSSVKEGPASIEQDLDEVRAASKALHEVMLATREEGDVLVVDCALNALLSACEDCVHIHVIGAGQAAYLLAISLREHFLIITTLKCLVPEYRRRMHEYWLYIRLALIRCLAVPTTDPRQGWVACQTFEHGFLIAVVPSMRAPG